jgi:hypothetical protein
MRNIEELINSARENTTNSARILNKPLDDNSDLSINQLLCKAEKLLQEAALKTGIDLSIHDPRTTSELLELCEGILNKKIIDGDGIVLSIE